MRILLLGPYFANKGHGAECGVYDAIVENGHSCLVIDPRTKQIMDDDGHISDGYEFSECPTFDPVDLVLCLGPGISPAIRDAAWFKYIRAPKVLWNSEPLRLDNYYSRMRDNKDAFDFFFTFDESDIPQYNKLGIENVKFLPQGYNPKWYNVVESPLKGHFCFVGSVGGKWKNRGCFLNRVNKFSRQKNLITTTTTCFDANQVNLIYSQHVGVLNLGLYHKEQGPVENLKSFGLQQRIFEAIGAGKIVITNEIPDNSNQLFTHGKDILFYNSSNLEEILDKILDTDYRNLMTRHILAIRDKHTYGARIALMIDKLMIAGIL